MKRIVALLILAALLCGTACAMNLGASMTPLGEASYTKRQNLETVVEALNGYCLKAGDVFSFDSITGAKDLEGADQAALTLYTILYKMNGIHFPGTPGYGGGTDLEFTADMDMTFEMWLTDTQLHCRIDTPDDRYEAFLDTEQSSWDMSNGSRLLSSASIPLAGSDSLMRNVSLAAESINDTLLAHGDVFSFNETVGPRTEKFGYREAVNGRGVEVIGGGVAQVASVIWLAVKNLDCIAVVQKSTYGERYNQSYVSGSNDAILTDYKAGTDFSFRYTGEGQITLITYISGERLCCDIREN